MRTLLAVSQLLTCLLAAATLEPTSRTADEILIRLAQANTKHHSIEYSSLRQYNLRNYRFDKQASMLVRMVHQPGQGKEFTVLTRTGSEKLNGIMNKLLESEAADSRPDTEGHHEISAANYRVSLLGTEVVFGKKCYVLELEPKAKSKYLIKGKAWVDTATFGIVRLEGQTARSVSVWVGQAQLDEGFREVDGIWVPARTRFKGSSFLLGASELEILYSDYQFSRTPAERAARVADGQHIGGRH